MIYETNYKKIMNLIPDLASFKIEDNRRSHLGGGYLDLCIDMVEITENHIMFALSQYYDNGNRDVDMIIKVYPSSKMAEVMAFQGVGHSPFQQVYFENEEGQKMVRSKLKKELNSYLRTWLMILKKQGHTLKEKAI
ncbi:unnamed protein product [marine sediment metagenome]|uniref:DUF1249 domain-containing protein n=1 Tax=marine sediment metagenome TaxID=412755 RepID=X1CQ85_9ZZZZ